MQDYAGLILEGVLLLAGIIAAWATMRSQLSELAREVKEVAEACDKLHARAEENAKRIAVVERDATHLDKTLTESLARIEAHVSALTARFDAFLSSRASL